MEGYKKIKEKVTLTWGNIKIWNKKVWSSKEGRKKELKILMASFVCGLALTGIFGVYAMASYSDGIQSGIATKVLRFHVLANSDSKEDQKLKLLVRDKILGEFSRDLSDMESIDDTKVFLTQSFSRIEHLANEVIKNEGYQYDVHVSLIKDLFPLKEYGDLTFPAGIYDALRVEIGDAKGKNWWCVMYPPMCFVDAAYKDVTEESKKTLEKKLSTEEYTVISANEKDKGFSPKLKFKVVEVWQEHKANKNIEKIKILKK